MERIHLTTSLKSASFTYNVMTSDVGEVSPMARKIISRIAHDCQQLSPEMKLKVISRSTSMVSVIETQSNSSTLLNHRRNKVSREIKCIYCSSNKVPQRSV